MNKSTGYYTVGNVEFESKITACLFASKTNQKVNDFLRKLWEIAFNN
jgi:hypothetical protein